MSEFYMGYVFRGGRDSYHIKGDSRSKKLEIVYGEVILPDDAIYLTIGEEAFEDAEIKKFDFSKVEFINESAFYGSQLEEADLSKVKTCRSYAFGACRNLRKVIIGASKIENRAFINCPELENVVLLEGVASIEQRVFGGTKIKSLKLPESIREFDLSSILTTPLQELEIPQNRNIKVTLWDGYRKETFPKLSKKSFVQLLKFYPQAYYELMPSEYFGTKYGFDKAFDDLCQNQIRAGLRMRGGGPTQDKENAEILSKVTERSLAEKKMRARAQYLKAQNGRDKN